MGSSRPRHSSGRRAASFRARKGKSKTSRRRPTPQAKPDFHAILGRLSDALSIMATATRAMSAKEQEDGSTDAVSVGDEIVTLEYGVRALRAAHDEMDVALRAVLP